MATRGTSAKRTAKPAPRPVISYTAPDPPRLIAWDGSAAAKRELRAVFRDAVAFVGRWAIVCSIEPAVVDQDGNVLAPEAARRQVVQPGEFVHVSDAPGPMTRDQVLANFPGVTLADG